MNLNKLRGVLAERRITQAELTKVLNLSLLSVNRKLNGKTPFTVEEAKKLVDYAKIEKPEEIFFT